MLQGVTTMALPDLFRRLVDDGRNVAKAELRLVKARAQDLVRRSRSAIVLLVIALLAIQGAVVALVVGLVLEMLPLVGPALAGLIVMVALLVVAGLLAWAAVHAVKPASTSEEAA